MLYNKMFARFILGTAQLGMPYGIANTLGQPSLFVAKDIINKAFSNNISYFDTAQVYGTSEQVLGQCLRNLDLQGKAKIITKVSAENLQEKKLLENALQRSLENFTHESLYCFMLHHEEYLPYLNNWQGEFLQEKKDQGIISKIGISVYAVEKAIEALHHPFVDVLQVPSSLFDRRFIEAGVFEQAKSLGKEIHVRSIFLQGVLCMPSEKLPICLAPLKEYVNTFQKLCNKFHCTPTQAALFYMTMKEPNSFLIFGVENSKQIVENVSNEWQATIDVENFFNELDTIKVPQLTTLLNPALWER